MRVIWNDTFSDGAPSWDIMAVAVSAFRVRIQGIASLIRILTIMRGRFQSQSLFGKGYVREVGEFV